MFLCSAGEGLWEGWVSPKLQELRGGGGGGGRDVLTRCSLSQAGRAGLSVSLCRCCAGAGTCCLQSSLGAFRAALVITPALHSNEEARLSYDSKNLRHASPGVVLDSETWVCEDNDWAGPET